jgi:hypothetical protein
MGIFSGFLLLVILVIIVVTAGIVLLIVFLTGQSSTPSTPQESRNDRIDMIRRVEGEKYALARWSGRSSLDIAGAGPRVWKKTMRWSLSGKIRDRGKEPVIAYYRVESLANHNGAIAAASSDFELFAVIEGGTIALYYDRKPLGQVVRGTLLDAGDKAIGRFRHPDDKGTNSFFHLQLYGRLLATFYYDRTKVPYSMSTVPVESEGGLFSLHTQRTTEDEKWLLALALLETVYFRYSFEGVDGRRNWDTDFEINGDGLFDIFD